MKKDLGVKPYAFPMPVLMIATYDEDGTVDVMNMAWGGVCDTDKVALNIGTRHKTFKNIERRHAFTLSIADVDHIEAADFFGIATGNKMADKFERSGLTATRSEHVDAPVVEEFPITMECEVIDIQDDHGHNRVLGRIVNVLADERVLDEHGKVDPTKVGAFAFDQFQNGYYAIGEQVGTAWKTGLPLMRGEKAE